MSSKPATETSPGTLKPAALTSVMKPIAIWSLPAKTAVGRLGLARYRPAAAIPLPKIEVPVPNEIGINLQARRPRIASLISLEALAGLDVAAGPLM